MGQTVVSDHDNLYFENTFMNLIDTTIVNQYCRLDFQIRSTNPRNIMIQYFGYKA
jgi:hypothetical protein